MQLEQIIWSGRAHPEQTSFGENATLVLAFGATERMRDPALHGQIRALYPRASVLGCSTVGEIAGQQVLDGTVATTAISFAAARTSLASLEVGLFEDSFHVGTELASSLDHEGLRHVLVFSDALQVNATQLARGMASVLPDTVTITGGLAGDGTRFAETFVMADAPARTGLVAALGFYGERLRIGWGSAGGWEEFGPLRLVTRSQANVLYELDGQPVLELYKRYLGKYAEGLPASALRFPLSIELPGQEGHGVVRTVVGVDEAAQSVIFAGDVPEGSRALLMYANFDRLVDGAADAAAQALAVAGGTPALALCISCGGRRHIFGQRVEDEIEAVANVLGPGTMLAGFYSYGELSPVGRQWRCELHNQTMTITTLSEDA